MSDLPVACSLSPEALQKRRELLVKQLMAQVEEKVPLDEGFRLRFPATDSVLAAITQVIQAERECCPFLKFDLTIEANRGPIWLSLCGPPGTRAFLEHELQL